jgi:hypothetical protein
LTAVGILVLALRCFAADVTRESRKPITSVLAIKRLSEDELQTNPRVRIEGVITYYDPQAFLFFVQDDTAGIYIHAGPEDFGLRTGDAIRVEGIAAKGKLSNQIVEPAFTILGRERLPKPKRILPGQISDPTTDCDLVQVEGTLRSIAEENGRLVYYVAVGNERIKVTVFTLARGNWSKNVGRTITICGVHAGLYNAQRQRSGMGLFCHSLRDIGFDSSESNKGLFDLPVQSTKNLSARESDGPVRLQIVADKVITGQFFVGHDETGDLVVRASQMSPVSKGTVLDVVGYLVRSNATLTLEDAYFQRIGFENIHSFKPQATVSKLRLIESAADIRRLPLEEARREYPVRLRGVITYYDPHWPMCFIQGATEGIFVNTHEQPLDISAGDLVILSGYTAPGDFAPMVGKPKFEVLGQAPMPRAKPVSLAQLLSGSEDSQWLQIDCVVRGIKDDGMRYDLEINPSRDPEILSHVIIPKLSGRPPPAELQGSRVEIEAVCATDSPNTGSHTPGINRH